MKMYLQLTHEEAARLVKEKSVEWWVEARLAVGVLSFPGFIVVSFVKVTRLNASKLLRPNRGQVIIVMSATGAQSRHFGKPITDPEPVVEEVAKARLIANTVPVPKERPKPVRWTEADFKLDAPLRKGKR